MAILQVRDIDDRLYESLKKRAELENRSISQEVINILTQYMNAPSLYNNKTTREFLSLSDAWEDERPAEVIIADIKGSRKKSERFGEGHVLFD